MIDQPSAPARRSDAAVAAVLSSLDTTMERGVVVDSPPGAGKSRLVVRAAAHLARPDKPVIVIAQTNEQVDDLVASLTERYPGLPVGRLHKSGYALPPRVMRPNVTASNKIGDLVDRHVVVGTAAKWAWVRAESPWSWAVVDEAYQMRSDALFKVASLFDQALFVGDPGQLDPFSTVATDRWAGQSWDPLRNAVDVTLAHNAGMPVHALPVSWRLPASAAQLIGEAFYPYVPFTSGTGPADRRLELATTPLRGGDPVDDVLAKAAASGWGYLELGHRETLPTDREAVEHIAALVVRLLQRGATAYSEQTPGGRTLMPERIAIGAARTVQVDAIRAALTARDPRMAAVTVDTANRLQGREFDVTIAWHPLAGRADASAFHLETGRLCVLLSRHRHACVIVGRRGIRELLDAHPSTQPVHLGVAPKFPDGWRAHQIVLDHLLRPEHHVRVA